MHFLKKNFKSEGNANPISANILCADPCAIEYEGRLYVYGTNDYQQYVESQCKDSNTYEKINSLVCFSTADMTNWTYHGIIDVKSIAPWILTSWAPVVTKRIEDDGKTHFYLYFSNSGCGVGVLTATSPIGPWSSPLNKPLINFDMKELNGVTNPFDPGVCIDDKGDGYLVCGGGYANGGDDFLPGSVRIVKLGKDMISFDSDFKEIKAPYFFEASDIYFMNGTYVYTYNNNWVERKNWNEIDAVKPSACSISYMVSKTPLVTESWKYKGHYFPNPGEMGLNYSNNHTFLCKFKNQYYIFYHSLALLPSSAAAGGYRSICVDKILVDEKNPSINMAKGTRTGVESAGFISPFDKTTASTMYNCEEIEYQDFMNGEVIIKSQNSGSWIEVRNVDFGKKASKIFTEAKGFGYISFHLDSMETEEICRIECENIDFENTCTTLIKKINGIHNVFFVFHTECEDQISFKSWYVK